MCAADGLAPPTCGGEEGACAPCAPGSSEWGGEISGDDSLQGSALREREREASTSITASNEEELRT
jgi:hypothetical protein